MKTEVVDLAASISAELQKYNDDIIDGLKTEIKNISKETVTKLKNTSPRNTGVYAKGWTYKIAYESNDDIRVQIYNKTKPQITHLLEYGHAKRHGGRVNGNPHIKPAEQEAKTRLENYIKEI